MTPTAIDEGCRRRRDGSQCRTVYGIIGSVNIFCWDWRGRLRGRGWDQGWDGAIQHLRRSGVGHDSARTVLARSRSSPVPVTTARLLLLLLMLQMLLYWLLCLSDALTFYRRRCRVTHSLPLHCCNIIYLLVASPPKMS